MFGIDFCMGGKEKAVSNTLSTRNNVSGVHRFHGDGTAVCVPIGCIDPQGRTNKEVSPSKTAPTLRAQAHGNEPNVCIPVLTPDRAEKKQNGRRFKDNGEESFTLTSQDRHGVAIKCDISVPVIWYDKYQCYIAIRKLTPRECFRLQGWTDDYFGKAEFVNSDSQLYKQAGNGVTVNVVYEIGKALR
jgi:DNA (cytosine-5)-methyltransferase 1